MTEVQRLVTAIDTISNYLARAAKANDKAALLKWSLRAADYSTRLSVLVSPKLAITEAAALGEPPVYDPPLTYDQETVIFLDAEDKLLIAQGKPAGRDGAERGRCRPQKGGAGSGSGCRVVVKVGVRRSGSTR